MGRWTAGIHKRTIADSSDNHYVALNELQASRLRDAHNADCDAYEARIAELDALVGDIDKIADRCEFQAEQIVDLVAERDTLREQLARVKAESLRVVVCGEARHPEKGEYHCLYENGGILAIHYKKNEMFFLSDRPGFVKLSKHADAFTPVRLERWETAE